MGQLSRDGLSLNISEGTHAQVAPAILGPSKSGGHLPPQRRADLRVLRRPLQGWPGGRAGSQRSASAWLAQVSHSFTHFHWHDHTASVACAALLSSSVSASAPEVAPMGGWAAPVPCGVPLLLLRAALKCYTTARHANYWLSGRSVDESPVGFQDAAPWIVGASRPAQWPTQSHGHRACSLP